MTIKNAYAHAVKMLNKNFIDNPSLEASLIISYSLNIDKIDIIINTAREINNNEWKKIQKQLNKRTAGKSIASIIKNKNFYDLDFYVDDSVLIPRPETELLIDIIKEKIDKNKKIKILDAGTGSGNIAVVLAKYFNNAFIHAVDVSSKALNIAKINIKKHNVENKIKLIKTDILKFIPKTIYDVIVSNPPYIETNEALKLLKNKIISDPIVSLNGGKDGFLYFRRLHYLFNNYTTSGGWMFFEHGINQRKKIMEIFKNKNYNIFKYNDLNNIDRIIAIAKKG